MPETIGRTEPRVVHITSRDNPLVQRIRKLGQDPVSYRKLGQIWLEGDHLCSAALNRQVPLLEAVIADTAWTGEHGVALPSDASAVGLSALARQAARVVVVPEALWRQFSTLESPTRLGALMAWPGASGADDAGNAASPPPSTTSGLLASARTVVLDRVQDAGNVGSILRSACAMGIEQVVALKGSAALWSPKVLRAAMGAHFGLHVVEQIESEQLRELQVPLVATSSHTDQVLPTLRLPDPCAWLFGHEGQGVSATLLSRCDLTVGIPQPGGEESLNVAAAAAVCLYEAMRQRLI